MIPAITDTDIATHDGHGPVGFHPPDRAFVSREERPCRHVDFDKQMQRPQTDFANFRRRVDNDRQQLADHRTAEVLTLLLPVVDDFCRALAVDIVSIGCLPKASK